MLLLPELYHLQNSYAKITPLNVTALGECAFEKVIKVNEVIRVILIQSLVSL